MATVKIGMAQMSVVFGKPEENLTMMERFLKLAAGKADIVVFPECCDLGWGNVEAPALCHPIPGATSEAYCRLAKQYHLWIAAGLTERAGKKTYNAALLISDSGEICLHHRKINVLTGVEDVYEIGDRLGVADTPFGRVALDICADNAESSMVLGEAFGRMGADILLSPSAWGVAPDRDLQRDVYGAEWHKPYSILSKKYGMAIVGVSNVGYLENGTWGGWRVIGNSIAYHATGTLAAVLSCGETAEEFRVVELETVTHTKKGTELAAYVSGMTER
ncbi:MAG: carbon-nitrogen hydrolase family protein [Lachnospiraceae bacterium]|nr:carbon-nitrogen hydrolase family protein [Lachnospiraceae bacterium]